MTGRQADVIRSGRDPDRPPRLPARRRLLAAAAAAVVLIGGAITAGILLAGQPAPGPRTGRLHAMLRGLPPGPDVAPGTMLRGLPPGPDVAPGTMLLLGGGSLRLLSLTGRAPVRLHWADTLLNGLTSPLGTQPGVQFIDPVSGGFVALIANDAGSELPAVGDVFFIPVTARGAAAPRLIAHANYLAVAPGGRDIWVQQASPPGHRPGDAWLIDRSGRRLSPVLRLGRRILLAATVRGLLTGTARGGGLRLISSASGAALSLRVPPGALLAAVGADQVAWQRPRCPQLACPLHVTSLSGGTGTVIALPPGTQTNGEPGAFDQAGRRIALPLDTIRGLHRTAETHIYVAGLGSRRMTRLPGGPLPLTQAATDLGAIVAGFPGFNSVSWPDGSPLWIMAADPAGFQAAYWTGSGPLRVLRVQPGEVYQFAIGAG